MLSFCRETHLLRQQRAVPDAAEHTSQLAFTSSSQHSGSSRRPRVIKRRARNRVVIVTTASLSIGKNDDIYTRKNDAVPRLKASRAQKQFHHRGDRRDRHSEARVRKRRRTGGRRGGVPVRLITGYAPRSGQLGAETRRFRRPRHALDEITLAGRSRVRVCIPTSPLCVDGAVVFLRRPGRSCRASS